MIEIPIELVVFLGIALGVICRTYFPYLRKVEEAQEAVEGTGLASEFTFDYKFAITAIFTGLVSAIFIYPTFVLPATENVFEIFIFAFIFAYGTNDIVNRLSH